MPLAAAHDYRASWEVPYDFQPRIRHYPGATSVVRAYMDAPLPTAASAGSTRTPRHRPQPPQRHYRLAPSPSTGSAAAPPTTAPTEAPPHTPQPRTEESPRRHRRRPARNVAPTRGSAWQPPQPAVASAPALTTSPVKVSVKEAAAARETSSKAADRGVSASAVRTQATPLAPPTRAPQRPQSAATVGVGRRVPIGDPASRLVGLHHTADASTSAPVAAAPAAPPPPAPAAATPPHTGYRPRTKLPYSLAPAYAAQRARWRHSPVPDITVADQHHGPPAAREYRLRAREVRHGTRAGFVDALRQSLADGGVAHAPADVVPHAVTAALTDAQDAHGFDPAQHNYSSTLVDAFAATVDERAAQLEATAQRMWERLILHVEPLPAAHQRVVAAGGASVLDGGHVSAPIHVSAAPGADGVDDDGESAMAVVVRPFADELPRSAEAVLQAEAQRRWPKGREWDRQAAIASAVGPTTQEAIIDLGIDPRYRQPGERPSRRRFHRA